ncbi:FMN-binding protein [Cryptosporangium aurantiacum]|uniref:FMN-binding domain-containing protein n=1 Tax=Cryptosporangium aurantiacum TaxID=134849 RepID=A0A1M7MBJ2_9ACTN|nr:FMN-binding protein [Cryptosporangium aurantiacum]SHM88170.1 FMN-binding domain-containing protein [Cryptosporangium aurantiacum]
MRRFLYALLGTVAGLGGLIGLKANLAPSEAVAEAAAPPPAAAEKPVAADPSAKADAPAGDAPAGDAPADGAPKTATGKVATNPYESLQVRVTVSGTSITKVEIAALNPKDKKSEQIAGNALPKLQQATLDANSADVDTVSGATFTTESYKESLQSALDQAGL